MAFNKLYVALVMVLVCVASKSEAGKSDSRNSSAGLPPYSESVVTGYYSEMCKCKVGYGVKECLLTVQKIGCCPLACGKSCICNKARPPLCFCSFVVETCNLLICPNSENNKA